MFYIGTIKKWFMERGRNIFRVYHSGCWKYYDPVVVGTALEAVEPEYQELLFTISKKVSSMPPGAIRDDFFSKQKEAVLRLAEVSRKIFELAPLTKEGDGVTDGEAIAIVTRYFLFMEEVARDSQLFQNSQSVA